MSVKVKQRGSVWSIKLAVFIYKIFGYNFIYYLLYPISFFYFIFATNVKESLKIYYEKQNIKMTSSIYFEHLRIFAICMVDRFVSKLDSNSYIFEYSDVNKQKEVLSQGTILLYSHFGGWAASANSPLVSSKINIVMQETLITGIKDIEENIDIDVNTNIIDINNGTLSVAIEIANALIDEEIVVMMVDRSANKKGEISSLFFNDYAKFNKNPFQIAYKMNKPIMAYFIVYKDKRTYEVIHIHIKIDKNLNEKDAIMKALNEYILEYEKIITKYPNQWFNFYNFWEK